jgi:hypothetical protein
MRFLNMVCAGYRGSLGEAGSALTHDLLLALDQVGHAKFQMLCSPLSEVIMYFEAHNMFLGSFKWN